MQVNAPGLAEGWLRQRLQDKGSVLQSGLSGMLCLVGTSPTARAESPVRPTDLHAA